MIGASCAGWAIEAMIASSLLMAFVLIVRKPAQRALGPQLAYWLWALPVLRMALPPIPAGWRQSIGAPISAASATMLVLFEPSGDAAVNPSAAVLPWLALIAVAWAIGALAFFAWHGAAHFAFVRRIVAPPARHAALTNGAILVESDGTAGPVAFGVLRRFVAVPRDFAERYDADERRLALAHEFGHHARGDLIANWIGLAMLALHWFNPLAWVAYRKFRVDQEMANDAAVLAALPAIERHAYACAILKAAHGRAVTAACHLHTIEDLKGRLRMLKADRKSRRVLLAGATGIAALTFAGLGLTASGAAAEQLRSVAAVQLPVLAAQVAPLVAPAPPAPPPSAAGEPRHVKRVTIVRDGKTEHYEGAEADAYIAAHPDMIPPTPPAPPVAGAAPAAPGAPAPPSYSTRRMSFVMKGDGADRQVSISDLPEFKEAHCGAATTKPAVMTYNDDSGGKRKTVICMDRIERYAADQAKAGLINARASIAAARAAITADRNLGEEQRRQALAGLDQAQAEIDEDIRTGKADK